MRRTTQTSLSDALSKYVRRLDRAGHLAGARVVDAWPEAVGPEIAKHTSDVFLREGDLVVHVDSPIWATELTALGEQLRQALNRETGEELVRSVRFTTSRKVQERRHREATERETEEFYDEDKVEPVPLTAEELERVRESAAAIGNPDLREAAIRATVKDLEWKRGLERRGGRESRDSGR